MEFRTIIQVCVYISIIINYITDYIIRVYRSQFNIIIVKNGLYSICIHNFPPRLNVGTNVISTLRDTISIRILLLTINHYQPLYNIMLVSELCKHVLWSFGRVNPMSLVINNSNIIRFFCNCYSFSPDQTKIIIVFHAICDCLFIGCLECILALLIAVIT